GIFRRLLTSLAMLQHRAPLEQLRTALTTSTEAFATALAGGKEADRVVLNNASFGANIDMHEVFENFRAVVVARDPLDQFSDRRNHDLKHWMRAERFVSAYRDSRQAFRSRRSTLSSEQLDNVREIEFERFVLDEGFRQSTLDWILQGRSARRVHQRFEP